MSEVSRRKRITWLFLLTVLSAWLGFCHEVLAAGGYTANYGASLSLKVPFLLFITCIFLIWLGWQFVLNPKGDSLIILAGGLVNYFDRLKYGYVRDYWHIPGTGIYNNLPDWIIFIGLLWYGLHISRRRDPNTK